MLTRRTLIAAFCAAAAFAATSSVQAAEDADILMVLKEIYNKDTVRDAEPFSKRLFALHEAAMAKSMELNEPVSGLDFDYVVNGQDFEEDTHASAKFEVLSKTDTKAEVKVAFKNFDMQELRYDMVLEEGTWWIDEVRCLMPGGEWVLSELLIEGGK